MGCSCCSWGHWKDKPTAKQLRFLKYLNLLVPPFHAIFCHFQESGKSACLLNEALGMQDMKTLRMMSFCLTRVAYLLCACAQVVDLLLPICDVLASDGIRKEESDIFLSPKSMIIMHFVSWLRTCFSTRIFKTFGPWPWCYYYSLESSWIISRSDLGSFRTKKIRKIVDSIKNLASFYKEKLISNIVTNVIDQNQKGP